MLLVCYGTRPEYLKLRPLFEKMKGVVPFKTLFVGQHTDLVSENSDYKIEISDGRNRLDSIVSSIMNCFDFKAEGVKSVLVQGDTTTAFAIALSAFNHEIPIVHLEAGLRTYNLAQPYPEEANRQMISRIASIHLCPTGLSKRRLISECAPGIIEVVGNTVLDNLVGIETEKEKKVLVTMHRRENHKNMGKWFAAIDNLAKEYFEYEFLLPIHPNPLVKKYQTTFKNINVVEPMRYNDLIGYLSRCSYVITDSGGIQEEASFLRKPCLVCRQETERTEGLNNFSLLCEYPYLLPELFKRLEFLEMKGSCPYGNGNAAQRIMKILVN
jgi:UDP-N-acetylglucosamine 2-epimerase (non-hydrolysing)